MGKNVPRIMGAMAAFAGSMGIYNIARYSLSMRDAVESTVIIGMGNYSPEEAYRSLYGVSSGDVAVGVLLVGVASLIGGMAYGLSKRKDEKFFRSWDRRN